MVDEATLVTCVICKRDREVKTCHEIKLTAEEQMALRAVGVSPPPIVLHYCRPCYRLLSNQTTAIEMMKGLVEANLRSAGVLDAEKQAERYKMRLIAASKTKPKIT